MKMQCRTKCYYAVLLSFLIASVFVLGGCTNPEKAKAEHLSRGEAYLKDSKFQEASIEFRNAVQIDDKLAAAHWGLARAYEGLQRYQETFEELKKTVALDPNNLEARINLGNYYLVGSKGKSDVIAEAEKLANEILAKDQNHIEGHILKGSVLYAQGKPAEAFAELNHAVELDPKRSESYLSLARFYIVNKEPAKAEETYQRAIAANPNSALAHTEWGKYLVGANKFPEAEAALKKAVEVEPTNRAAHYYLASFYLVSKQLDKAEAAYRELANFDKDKPEGQAIMGDFYSSVNRLDEAAKIYEDILSKSPEYSQGRYRLAEINLARGDRKKAGDQIDELLKKDQRDRHALLLRARVNASTNDSAGLKLAIDDLKEVLKQEPNSKAGLYFMAQANFNLGLIDQARAFAADLERNYPDYLPAKLTLIQISLATGDTKGATRLATELLDRLSRTGPDRDHSPQILNEIQTKTLLARGSAAAQSGNIAAARQDFMAASALSPKNTDVYANLAALSTLENKSEEAAGFYEKALAIDATNFNAMSGILGLHVRANAFDKAHSRVDQALSSYPNNASMHYLKAQIYGAERNQQGAETELRKTLELDANYIAAYSALGALFVNTKQEPRAIEEYTKITERRPENATAWTLIGMLYDSMKKPDDAEQNYRKALEKDQNAVIAANNLAWLIATEKKDTGNLDEAVRLAQGVVQKNPNVAGFVDTLGWVYYQKGLYAAAAEQLQKAVSLDEAAAKKANTVPSATYHYHLGMALNAKGDKAGARRELSAALQLADKVPFAYAEDARKALATL